MYNIIITHKKVCVSNLQKKKKKKKADVYETLWLQHMLAAKDNLETRLLYYTNCQSWKKGYNSAKYLQNFAKS